MSDTDLRQLAKRIFEITRRQVWLGGKCPRPGVPGPNWPKGVEVIEWSEGLTWTLSPEVELGGMKLRVCISWDGNNEPGTVNGTHGVRVFVDGELKYPGGFYKAANREGLLWEHRDAWSWKIARTERTDGGRNGRVSARTELLAEAKVKAKGVPTVQHEPDVIYCAGCEQALAELEEPEEP